MHHVNPLMALTYVDEINSLGYTLGHLSVSRMPTEIQLCGDVGLYYKK